MSKVSLARIMYGTAEDFHSADSMNVRATSLSAQLSNGNASAGVAHGSPASMLSNLLHRAWAALHGKS